jgi:hypothetical protein
MKSVRRRRAFFFGVLAALPIALLAFRAGPGSRAAREWMLLLWVGLYVASVFAYVFCRCPACGRLFHSVYFAHNPVSARCRSCGLSCGRKIE